jgi:hypothetical protein
MSISLSSITSERVDAIFAEVKQMTQESQQAIGMLSLVDILGSMNEQWYPLACLIVVFAQQQ